MGLILSRFRKKKSTIEILDDVDMQINKLQQFRRQNQERLKKLIGRLILYSIVLYIGAALIFYFYYLPPTWTKRLMYSSPLLIFPFLIWILKKFLHWFFVKRITKNDMALSELQEEKKKILEDVMEKETYKKAREILQKYDPARFKQLETPAIVTPARSGTEGSAVRQRNVPSSVKQMPPMRPATPYPARHLTPRPRMNTPTATPRLPQDSQMRPRALATPQLNGNFEQIRGPPLPRPILPRERSTMDRVLEYLVGDGPQNRYALICRFCHSHNGMALKEEFEYISFRCCYCYQMNMAKKQRPFAPKLEVPPPAAGIKRQLVLGGVIEEGNDSDEEDEDGSFEEEEQSEEDTNEGNAVTNDSKDSDVPSANTSENATIKPHDREQGRQSELKCPQINGVSTDEETEKEIRPS